MDIGSIATIVGCEVLYGTVSLVTGIIFGWFMYDRVLTKGISLRDALFEHDAIAPWTEFMGSFVFPVLFLASRILSQQSPWLLLQDTLSVISSMVLYIAIFSLLRMVVNAVILKYSRIEKGRYGEIVTLNDEIFQQNNFSASMFSVAMTTVIINLSLQFEFTPVTMLDSMYRFIAVLLASFIAIALYQRFLPHGTGLFQEIFIKNNPACGISFAGYILSWQILLHKAFTTPITLYGSLAAAAISLLLLHFLASTAKRTANILLKVDFKDELFTQKNIGAALGDLGLHVGLSMLIASLIR